MQHQEDEFLSIARRLLRSGQEHAVLLVRLTVFPHPRHDPGLMVALQNNVRDTVQSLGGQCFLLKSGDFFVTGQGLVGARRARLIDALTAIAFADRAVLGEPSDEMLKVYTIPRDWVPMREHTGQPGADAEIAQAGAAQATGPAAAASTSGIPLPGAPAAASAPNGAAPQAAAPAAAEAFVPLEGPLTARMLPRVEDTLARIDFARYVRRQTVYETDHRGAFRPLWTESSTDIAALRRDHFPAVDLRRSAHLFLELCRTFDARMLKLALIEAGWTRGAIGLNLSLATIQGQAFKPFADVCRPERRRNVVLEVHRADLFISLGTRGQSIEELREAGWRIALDGVTPAVLPYLNVTHPAFDFVKVLIQRDEIAALSRRECLEALRGMDRSRLVFARCDQQGALDLAKALGVTRVQGDLVDRLAAEAGQARATA
jgi:hypothetical protein